MALRTSTARKVAAALVAAPLVLVPVLAAPPAGALARQSANEVDAVDELKFVPATLTVPVGTTVTWLNKGVAGHTVTGGDGAPDANSPIGNTPLATQGATVTKTFEAPGTYPYFCTPHVSVGMKGVIVVTAAAAGGASAGGSAAPSSAGGGAAAPSSGAAASASPAAPSSGAAASTAGAAVPGAPGAPGGAGPAGAPAGSGGAGTAPAGAGAGSLSASPSGSATPDPSLGAPALKALDERLNSESKPLSSFRLALAALTLAVMLLGAGVYFVTRPRRDDE